MKRYALTSIEVDDKDQKKCGECHWSRVFLTYPDKMTVPYAGRPPEKRRVCDLFGGELLAEGHDGKCLRCPACIAASAINPLIEAIERAEAIDFVEEIIGTSGEPRVVLKAALDLKGKLK